MSTDKSRKTRTLTIWLISNHYTLVQTLLSIIKCSTMRRYSAIGPWKAKWTKTLAVRSVSISSSSILTLLTICTCCTCQNPTVLSRIPVHTITLTETCLPVVRRNTTIQAFNTIKSVYTSSSSAIGTWINSCALAETLSVLSWSCW